MDEDRVSLLSGPWLNKRIDNVVEKAIGIWERILFEGIVSEGVLPGEAELTKETLAAMTDEQFDMLMETSDPADQPMIIEMQRQLEEEENAKAY